MYIVLVSVFFFRNFFVAAQGQFSSYLVTEVLTENKSCIQVHFTQTPSKRVTQCANFCSLLEECRRFMFDLEMNTCYFYTSGNNCYTSGEVYNKICYRQKSLCNSDICTRCPIGYYGIRCENVITHCCDGFWKSVIPVRTYAFIQPSPMGTIVEVYCNAKFALCETLILRREKPCIEANFNRTWIEYLMGFGQPNGEHFIGLKTMYDIVRSNASIPFALKVFIKLGDRKSLYFFGDLIIGNETDGYYLWTSSTSHRNDSMFRGSYGINSRPFSTYDRDLSGYNCPQRFGSGWWYLNDPVCSRVNVLGVREGGNQESGIHWHDLGNITDFSKIQFWLIAVK